MIKFTIGIVLAIFSAIVGGYQYFSNEEILQRQQQRLVEIDHQKVEAQQMLIRLRRIADKLMVRGDDQRANIEKLLGLADTKLNFRFITQADPNAPTSEYFYRHEFEISGPTDYFKGMQMINKTDNLAGVVLYQTCFNCTRINRNIPIKSDEQVLLIKGYLYVHNPEGHKRG